jgi:thioredoxin 1
MNYIKNHDQFNEVIKKDKVLIDFYAEWCGPCKMLSPILEKVSNDLKVDTYKVNVDEVEDLAREYAIMSIPTLLLFEKGELVNKHIGFMVEEELREFLK